MQVVNADAMVVKLNSGEYKTIHLSSIRPPRNEGEVQTNLFSSACINVITLDGVSGYTWVNKLQNVVT